MAAQSRTLSGDEIGRICGIDHARGSRREPIARIVGHKEFWGLPFRLSPETLVPRPETRNDCRSRAGGDRSSDALAKSLRVADLGTGSGALLLALLLELPRAIGIGTDLSVAALATAHDNALHSGSYRTLRCSSRAISGRRSTGGFDLVVSNPPYVATAEHRRRCRPRCATTIRVLLLTAAATALTLIGNRADAARLLAAGGRLVLEIGAGQANMVAAIMPGRGLVNESPPRADLAGIDRALTFRLRS